MTRPSPMMSSARTAHNRGEIHADYSHDFWTPPEWWEWVRKTLGVRGVFDPCPGDWGPDLPSGLDVLWLGPTYVNHPGARGSTSAWWAKYLAERPSAFIWCAFSVEQFRHMLPSALELPGWLVAPRTRVSFIWGGPDMPGRVHGQPLKSPANWTAFWSTVEPARPPVDSIIVRTGA